jgi:hypothetical protein
MSSSFIVYIIIKGNSRGSLVKKINCNQQASIPQSQKNAISRFAKKLRIKNAFGSYLVSNIEATKSSFFYTAWATLHSIRETNAVPSPGLNPGDFKSVRKEILKKDPEAYKKIVESWAGEGKVAWTKLLERGAYLYNKNPDTEEFGTEIYIRLFLTPHSQNSAKPDPPRTSKGLSPSQMKGGVWYRLNKDNTSVRDIAEGIYSIRNYINTYLNPKGVKKLKTRYDEGIDSRGKQEQGPKEYDGDIMDLLVSNEPSPEDVVTSVLAGHFDKLDPLDEDYVKHLRWGLGLEVSRMLDEDWMFVVGVKWNDEMIKQIAETCKEVSSARLAPLVIKNFKFLSLKQLKILVTFVEDCIEPNHRYFGEVKRGKTLYYKRLRMHTKSVPQWLNLFLAVHGPFSYGGATFRGALHNGPTAWSTSIRGVVDSDVDLEAFVSALWSKSKMYMPTEVMALNYASFREVLFKYIDGYLNILETEPPQKANDKFKSFCKNLFKEKNPSYLEQIIAVPMAEATRMRLIQLVVPDKFRDELTSENYISCGNLLEKLLNIPASVVEAVRERTKPDLVDQIISRVEAEVVGRPILVQKQ